MSLKETMKKSAQSWVDTIELQHSQQQLQQQLSELSQQVQQLQQQNNLLQQHLTVSLEAQATSQTAWIKLNQRLLTLEKQLEPHSASNPIENRIDRIESHLLEHDRNLSEQQQQLQMFNKTFFSLQSNLTDFVEQLRVLENADAALQKQLAAILNSELSSQSAESLRQQLTRLFNFLDSFQPPLPTRAEQLRPRNR